MLRFIRVIPVSIIVCFFMTGIVEADTVIMKDNRRVKGVIVEEYKDRVILSTMDGEKEILKAQIKNIIYDLQEQNLTNLGDFYQDRRMYEKAYYYYKQALEVNPEYKRARESLNYVGTFIQQSSRMRKLNHIQKLNEGKTWRDLKRASVQPADDRSKIKRDLGLVIEQSGGKFFVSEVVKDSPAYNSGVEKGDNIIGAWGRALGYMDPEEVYSKLANSGVMDVQLVIERKVSIDSKEYPQKFGNDIGIKLGFSEMEGLMVEEVHPEGSGYKAGVKKGDTITAINGENTRYMPLSEVVAIINDDEDAVVEVIFKRDVVLWKKFKA